MTMHGKLSSVVVAGFAMAAAVLPTAAFAQQTDTVAISQSDTAKPGGIRVIRSDADTSEGEIVDPAGSGMSRFNSGVQQLIQQMFGSGSIPRAGTTATPRVRQGADSAGAIKKSSDSTAADAAND